MSQQVLSPNIFSPVRGASQELRPQLILDPLLVIVPIGLVLFSLVMLYSTTGITSQEHFGDSLYYVKRQFIAAIIGSVLMVVLARVPISLLQRVSPYLIVGVLGLLILTFVPGLGDSAGGAQRWLKLGPIRFQPGELVKLFFVIFICGFWARHEHRAKEFIFGLVKPVSLAGVVGAMLLLQPDFGSASIIVLVTLGIALAAGTRLSYLGIGFISVMLAAAVLILVSPYRMARITSFLSPFSDASGRGYQLIQSLIAVGTGQVTGVGLGSSQQKLFYLPAAHTDFIFAVVAEELGFIGAVALIFAFVLFLWRGLKLASRVREHTFAFLLSIGLTLLVVLPALLNIGVVIGLLPTKGLVLPLVGYGGSSLIASLMAVGIMLSIGRDSVRGRL